MTYNAREIIATADGSIDAIDPYWLAVQFYPFPGLQEIERVETAVTMCRFTRTDGDQLELGFYGEGEERFWHAELFSPVATGPGDSMATLVGNESEPLVTEADLQRLVDMLCAWVREGDR